MQKLIFSFSFVTLLFFICTILISCANEPKSINEPELKQNPVKLNKINNFPKFKESPYDGAYLITSFTAFTWNAVPETFLDGNNETHSFLEYRLYIDGYLDTLITEINSPMAVASVSPHQMHTWQVSAVYYYSDFGVPKEQELFFDEGEEWEFQCKLVAPTLSGELINQHPNLMWNQGFPVASYKIYYSANNIDYTLLTTINGTLTSYQDNSYTRNNVSPRYYRVQAWNPMDESPLSNSIKFGGPSEND